jgi:hypothetical protein
MQTLMFSRGNWEEIIMGVHIKRYRGEAPERYAPLVAYCQLYQNDIFLEEGTKLGKHLLTVLFWFVGKQGASTKAYHAANLFVFLASLFLCKAAKSLNEETQSQLSNISVAGEPNQI